MVKVARGPGKTTCKHCRGSITNKALKIITSFGSYHVRCWKPPRPFQLSEFEGFSKLDDKGKVSFRATVEKWLEPYNKQEAKIIVHNEISNAKRRIIDMGDHKALKIVEGFEGFRTVPTLVLSHIAGFLDGEDLKEIAVVSKHWSVTCKDDLTWKGACRLYPAANLVHDKINKTWYYTYNVLANPKATQGYCVECGNRANYNSMFACFLCSSPLCTATQTKTKYKVVTNLKKFGLTDSDITKYGIRACMGDIEDESWKHREVTFMFALVDIIFAQKQKALEKYGGGHKRKKEDEDEEEVEEQEKDEEKETETKEKEKEEKKDEEEDAETRKKATVKKLKTK